MAQQQGGAPHAEPAASTPDPIDITPPADARPAEDAAAPGDRPPPAGDPAPPAAAASRAGRFTRRRVVLGSMLAVGLAGAAILGTAGVRILQQKDATLTAPDRVAGLTRDSSEQAADMADYLRTALAAGIELDKTVGAVYADPTDADRGVLFYGGTALIFTPERELDDLFGMLNDKTGSVTGLREVPAGDLGGVMKCGAVALPEGGMSACGWADHGSVAVALFPDRTVDQAAPLMRDLRTAIETRD